MVDRLRPSSPEENDSRALILLIAGWAALMAPAGFVIAAEVGGENAPAPIVLSEANPNPSFTVEQRLGNLSEPQTIVEFPGK